MSQTVWRWEVTLILAKLSSPQSFICAKARLPFLPSEVAMQRETCCTVTRCTLTLVARRVNCAQGHCKSRSARWSDSWKSSMLTSAKDCRLDSSTLFEDTCCMEHLARHRTHTATTVIDAYFSCMKVFDCSPLSGSIPKQAKPMTHGASWCYNILYYSKESKILAHHAKQHSLKLYLQTHQHLKIEYSLLGRQ